MTSLNWFTIVLAICISHTEVLGQLCQGAYWSEIEAEQQMSKWSTQWRTKEEWMTRAAKIKLHLKQGMQWDKMPTDLAAPNVIIHSEWKGDGYTVANIAIESLPGFYVTGNIYTPIQLGNKNPAILCPHGHWNEPGDVGRFRADMQSRCAALAKMGALVVAYDMIGYGESQQVTHHMPYALLLQTWNSKRIIDYLYARQDVDTARIGITGASGGGTQTFMITALDDRITVSAPAVMVAAHFFGGCVCESGMPVHQGQNHQTNNVEIAGLAAPRSMLIVSNGHDWTANNPYLEFPYLQKIYASYGARTRVKNVHLPMERHDYGLSKRSALYPFMARELDLDINALEFDDVTGKYIEDFVEFRAEDQLKVFIDPARQPTHLLRNDQEMIKYLQNNFDIK